MIECQDGVWRGVYSRHRWPHQNSVIYQEKEASNRRWCDVLTPVVSPDLAWVESVKRRVDHATKRRVVNGVRLSGDGMLRLRPVKMETIAAKHAQCSRYVRKKLVSHSTKRRNKYGNFTSNFRLIRIHWTRTESGETGSL